MFSTLPVAFADAVSVLLSFFHAHSPSTFDHELSAGADATASSFLACSCAEGGGATALDATGTGFVVLEAAAAASSLIGCE